MRWVHECAAATKPLDEAPPTQTRSHTPPTLHTAVPSDQVMVVRQPELCGFSA